MARLLPIALEKLIDELGRLPGVGQRTANDMPITCCEPISELTIA